LFFQIPEQYSLDENIPEKSGFLHGISSKLRNVFGRTSPSLEKEQISKKETLPKLQETTSSSSVDQERVTFESLGKQAYEKMTPEEIRKTEESIQSGKFDMASETELVMMLFLFRNEFSFL